MFAKNVMNLNLFRFLPASSKRMTGISNVLVFSEYLKLDACVLLGGWFWFLHLQF